MVQDKLVLMVSKHPNQKRMYVRELEEVGYSVVSADCGHSAKTEIELLKEGAIDLIIMGSVYGDPEDHWTMELEGVAELEEAVLGMTYTPPILVHSSYSEAEAKRNFEGRKLEPLIQDYLGKDSDPTGFVKKVTDMIGPV